LEGQLPFPALTLGQGRLYKVTALITNRDLPGPDLIGWYRGRCGKSEEVHRVLKEELAGGTLPSGSFGENAAWWAIAALAFNVHTAVKGLALGGPWVNKRLKTIRFHLLAVPGRVLERGGQLLVRIGKTHPAFTLLCAGRGRFRALLAAPS
ncbi:MAG: transposase, partial [Chloroflexi bacterium]|nr:transposase [Chloroflexota bacterium]